jgi:hypothetical protein
MVDLWANVGSLDDQNYDSLLVLHVYLVGKLNPISLCLLYIRVLKLVFTFRGHNVHDTILQRFIPDNLSEKNSTLKGIY